MSDVRKSVITLCMDMTNFADQVMTCANEILTNAPNSSDDIIRMISTCVRDFSLRTSFYACLVQALQMRGYMLAEQIVSILTWEMLQTVSGGDVVGLQNQLRFLADLHGVGYVADATLLAQLEALSKIETPACDYLVLSTLLSITPKVAENVTMLANIETLVDTITPRCVQHPVNSVLLDQVTKWIASKFVRPAGGFGYFRLYLNADMLKRLENCANELPLANAALIAAEPVTMPMNILQPQPWKNLQGPITMSLATQVWAEPEFPIGSQCMLQAHIMSTLLKFAPLSDMAAKELLKISPKAVFMPRLVQFLFDLACDVESAMLHHALVPLYMAQIILRIANLNTALQPLVRSSLQVVAQQHSVANERAASFIGCLLAVAVQTHPEPKPAEFDNSEWLLQDLLEDGVVKMDENLRILAQNTFEKLTVDPIAYPPTHIARLLFPIEHVQNNDNQKVEEEADLAQLQEQEQITEEQQVY